MIRSAIINNCMILLSERGELKLLQKRDELNVNKIKAKTLEEKQKIDMELNQLNYATYFYRFLKRHSYTVTKREEANVYFVFWKTQYDLIEHNDY